MDEVKANLPKLSLGFQSAQTLAIEDQPEPPDSNNCPPLVIRVAIDRTGSPRNVRVADWETRGRRFKSSRSDHLAAAGVAARAVYAAPSAGCVQTQVTDVYGRIVTVCQ